MSTVKVLSVNRADPIHFTKINEFGDMQDLTPEDMLFITGERNGEEITKNVRVRDFGQFFTEFNVNAQWFIPVVNETEGIISWQWSEAVNSLPDIHIAAMIPTVSSDHNGLMTSVDKARLDALEGYSLPVATTTKLGGVKPDGRTVHVNANGVLTAVTGVPTCTKCTLSADGWDRDTSLQKVSLSLNINNRNVVDYPPEFIDIVSQYHIIAVKEEADGVTFQCSGIPLTDITVYITSMGVIR